MTELLLPIPEAGRLLGYSGKTRGKTSVYQHLASGRLTRVKLGGRTFVTRESAERLIRQSIVEGLSDIAVKETI